MPDARPTVVVIGAGIAGLAAAWELSGVTPRPRVVVLDGADRAGGKILTEDVGGRTVDVGPDAFVAQRPEGVELCGELGLADELVAPGSKTAFVWSRGRLRPLPPGLALGVPTRVGPLARSGICSPVGWVRAAADLARVGPIFDGASDDVSVGEIVRRSLGAEVADQLADPLIGGIHASSIDSLSAAAVFPPLLDAARRGGSLLRALRHTTGATTGGRGRRDHRARAPADRPVFLTVREGLGLLVRRLVDQLRARGVELRLGAEVVGLRPGEDPGTWEVQAAGDRRLAGAVVLAVPAPRAASLVRPVDRALATSLDGIRYATVNVVTLRLPADRVPVSLDGTGFLVPRRDHHLVTACTWLTTKWPHLARAGEVLMRASCGRAGDDRADAMPDDALVRRTLSELGPMMGGAMPAPLEARVTRWPDAFPQYAVGHLRRVTAIHEATDRLGGLAVAGALLDGVGVPACIASGRTAARRVLWATDPSPGPTDRGAYVAGRTHQRDEPRAVRSAR